MKFIALSDRDAVGIAICEACGVDPATVRRIVIDLQRGHAGIVYLETFADDEKLAVALAASGLEVRPCD